jgi:hypothetical protein
VPPIIRKHLFYRQEKKDFTPILLATVCKIVGEFVFEENLDYILWLYAV